VFARLKPGDEVICGGRRYRLGRPLDFTHALAYDLVSGEVQQLPIQDITPTQGLAITPLAPSQDPLSGPDLQGISDEEWQIALKRFEALKPLLALAAPSRQAVNQRALEVGVHSSTLYRWLRAYKAERVVQALVNEKPGPAAQQGRLSTEVESIISVAIQNRYLRRERPSVESVVREVILQCRRAELHPPHANTVRRRVKWLDKEETERRRSGEQGARRYTPIVGEMPNADWPLAVVQIDHTKIDLILVDDVHRRPIGRPWITLAIDVFSRMVAGFYVSFDPPCAFSVGLCLAHAILPKEVWLAKHEIKASWPVWGLMNCIHCDNGKDFRGDMLKKACRNYGINPAFRPVRKPWYGGHIERLLGTALKEIHTLPGTTFSNPSEKGRYDSERKAILTLGELEQWLATFFIQVYHQRVHSALGVSPLKRYEQGIFGDGTQPGRGLPARCTNEAKLRLDFMPCLERTVQRSGLTIDGIHYYADVLRPWIGARDPDNCRRNRKFIVRRDPRDISVVYFYDPDLERYFEIPYRDRSRPPLSIWELREVQRHLRKEGRQSVDEELIFDAYARMRAIEESALRNTQSARRNEQRRRLHARVEKPGLASEAGPAVGQSLLQATDKIQPFDEVEELD
jgi:putative transposase